MRPRELHRRVAAALFVLVALAAKLVDTANSEEPIFSQLDSNQNISLDSEFKSQASKDETSPEQQNWLFHVQGTEIAQGQPGFHSPYHGPNSLLRADTFRQTSSLDIYLGLVFGLGANFMLTRSTFKALV
jgi:hypothetical protein